MNQPWLQTRYDAEGADLNTTLDVAGVGGKGLEWRYRQ